MQATTDGAAAGHRVLPHTSDNVIHAWGPDPGRCAEEAVRGLLDCFLDTTTAEPAGAVRVAIGKDAPETMLLALLDEIIYWTDVGDEVPVDSEVTPKPGGDWQVRIWTAPRDQVELIGAAPKAATRHELVFAPDASGVWHCRVLLDV